MAKKKKLTDGDYDFSVITREHVLSAIQEIEDKGIPSGAKSTVYDLFYEGKMYPPKLVLSWAYRYATGEEARRTGVGSFEGGKDTACFNCLESLGFNIVLKRSNSGFRLVIDQFLKQANEQSGQSKDSYLKKYEGLEVDLSFGFGNYTHVPWISFLYEGQTTQEGIYPVFLYYKKQNLLILAYGVSEKKKPVVKWNFPEKKETVKEYFTSQGLGKPYKYGGCYVFKVYPLADGFEGVDFDKDLKEIISYYKKIMADSSKKVTSTPIAVPVEQTPFDISRLSEIRETGLLFGDELLRRYAVSLLTKPFVILSGLSGSGKTRLALAFARWMASDQERQVKIVPVGADWNSREYLLGYPNALTPGTYVRPENGVLDFVLEAAREENRTKPFFLILDEMNLSYVERYFSDFLSAMESKEAITLHPREEAGCDWDVEPEVVFPPNLFLIGTINVDETTYMFSPKVLDRANVIEFRISREEMADYLAHCSSVKPDVVNGKGASMGADFVRLASLAEVTYDKEYKDVLLSFFEELKPVGAEFGYRTAAEIYRFIALAQLVKAWDTQEGEMKDRNKERLVDVVVMQKLLPKLHGSRKKMQPVLKALWKLCKRDQGDEKVLIEADAVVFGEKFRYPLSAEKVWLMYRNAQDNGFTSYAEA